jgi:hypothetical protein
MREADSESGFPQATRGGVAALNPLKAPAKMKKKPKLVKPKPKAVPVREGIRFLAARFMEAKRATDTGDAKVVILEEGMGNFGDRFYYPAKALESAVPLFEGRKMFADHPSELEQQTRPERSVRDIVGHFENVEVDESEERPALLLADAVTIKKPAYEWARGLLEHAVEYSKNHEGQEFVGLSIVAGGYSEEIPIEQLLEDDVDFPVPEACKDKLRRAQKMGIDSVRVVDEFTKAKSADLVTEAGAGGKVLEMIEEEKDMPKTKIQGKKNRETAVSEALKAASQAGAAAARAQEAGGDEEEEEIEEGAGGEQEEGDEGEGGGGEDDTAAGDKSTIKKMMVKHMGGKEEDHSDEAAAGFGKALQEAKGLGYEGEEAEKCAAYEMRKASKGKTKESEDAPPPAASKESERRRPNGKGKSLEAQLMESNGRIAKLEQELSQSRTEKYLDKVLSESGLPRAVTKKFRESQKSFKNEKDVDTRWKAFLEGYESAGKASGGNPFVVSAEKTHTFEESEGGERELDLSDCVRAS